MPQDDNLNISSFNRAVNNAKINNTRPQVKSTQNSGIQKQSFADVLKNTVQQKTFQDPRLQRFTPSVAKQIPSELTISKHASQRLMDRGIELSEELLAKINKAVNRAAEKNIKNALILFDDNAFIVSVENNVLVTAMDSSEMRENIITNIDGTVIL